MASLTSCARLLGMYIFLQSTSNKQCLNMAESVLKAVVDGIKETAEKNPQKEADILYKIGEVEVNEAFLRKVAISILQREQQIQHIKDKMCTHGQEMCDVWKLGKQWGQLSEHIKQELKKTIPPREAVSCQQACVKAGSGMG